MKTLATLKNMTVFTLVAALTFGPVSLAAAADVKWAGFNKPKTAANFGKIDKNAHFGGPLVPVPQPNNQPNQQPNTSNNQTEVHHYHRDNGAAWGALAGGTMLGLVMGSMANQPQESQATVVYVQQPNADTQNRDKELELEIERERAKARALELELEKLRAERTSE